MWRGAVLVAAVLVLGGGVVASVASSAVEVVVDGESSTTRTFAADVAGVLARLQVAVGEYDLLDPPADTPVEDGLRIVVTHAKTVTVHEIGQAPQQISAVVDTVADVLAEAGLTGALPRSARIDPDPETPVADGDRIEIRLPVPVTFVVDGGERQMDSYADTVAAALAEAGIEVGEHDLVEPPRGRDLQAAGRIVVRRVEVVTETREVPVAFEEDRRETSELVVGETQVEIDGEDGLARETHEIRVVDGEEAGREVVDEEVLREPTDRVVLVGVGPGPLREAQRLLDGLGYPVGPVDGIEGPQTQRALCAWRRLEGHEVARGGLRPGEIELLRATSELPAADGPGRGVTVDRTCQALYYRDGGRWQQVHPASTGADGLPGPGDYTIQRTRPGWHTSTLYPAPQPNMYNSLYIRGAIAIHGSNQVPAHPASKGCVRVTPASADRLFADLGVGDPVRVIGAY
jgi:uncharacterized protein YabE (DUF348 family)